MLEVDPFCPKGVIGGELPMVRYGRVKVVDLDRAQQLRFYQEFKKEYLGGMSACSYLIQKCRGREN